MRLFNNAKEVIERNQEAVIVFTRGEHFQYDSAGNGFTGKWVIDSDVVESVDKVIVYLRRDGDPVNRIFLGNYAGVRKSDVPDRYLIRFWTLTEVGTTEANWSDFANSGQNPVGYVIE